MRAGLPLPVCRSISTLRVDDACRHLGCETHLCFAHHRDSLKLGVLGADDPAILQYRQISLHMTIPRPHFLVLCRLQDGSPRTGRMWQLYVATDWKQFMQTLSVWEKWPLTSTEAQTRAISKACCEMQDQVAMAAGQTKLQLPPMKRHELLKLSTRPQKRVCIFLAPT